MHSLMKYPNIVSTLCACVHPAITNATWSAQLTTVRFERVTVTELWKAKFRLVHPVQANLTMAAPPRPTSFTLIGTSLPVHRGV